MANRYINCLTEPAVSMLYERSVSFRFLLGDVVRCQTENAVAQVVGADGTMELKPGKYVLRLR